MLKRPPYSSLKICTTNPDTPEINNYIFNNLSTQLERISSDKTIVDDIVKTHTYIHFLKHLMQK